MNNFKTNPWGIEELYICAIVELEAIRELTATACLEFIVKDKVFIS